MSSSNIQIKKKHAYFVVCVMVISTCLSLFSFFSVLKLSDDIKNLDAAVNAERDDLNVLKSETEDQVLPMLKKSADDVNKATNYLLEIVNILTSKSGATRE